jgi:hypothetical protein
MAGEITNVDTNFINYFRYVESMQFDQTPDYKYLQSLFRKPAIS